jgi:hypothetical protein
VLFLNTFGSLSRGGLPRGASHLGSRRALPLWLARRQGLRVHFQSLYLEMAGVIVVRASSCEFLGESQGFPVDFPWISLEILWSSWGFPGNGRCHSFPCHVLDIVGVKAFRAISWKWPVSWLFGAPGHLRGAPRPLGPAGTSWGFLPRCEPCPGVGGEIRHTTPTPGHGFEDNHDQTTRVLLPATSQLAST